MIKLYNKTTAEFIGRISEEDLQFLADELEEESLHDTDYYIRKETVDGFKDRASDHLMEVLRGAMRHDASIEIRWERDEASV